MKYTTLVLLLLSWASVSQAMDLDWHGQFRAETNTIYGYSHDTNWPGAGHQGYLIPKNGESPATFQNLFFRLNPDVIVNDNISLRSEWWMGTPDRGMFGSGQSTNFENRQFWSTSAGNSGISARLFYMEATSDIGIVTVGRAPLHWGLGLVWNSAYNQNGAGVDKFVFDRFPTNADVIKMTTKIGSFKFTPAFVKYRIGSNFGGGNTIGGDIYGATGGGAGTTLPGSSNATDYSLGLTYESPDDRLEMGALFLRRLAGPKQDGTYGSFDPTSSAVLGVGGYTYNIWDFVVKKGVGIFDFGAEVPITSGRVAGYKYSTIAFAGEANAKISEQWDMNVKAGQAPGQEGYDTGGAPTSVTAFAFHPDYRPGFLMFNYNYRNFSESFSGNSPYDNPIVNARYLALGGGYSVNKWSFRGNFVYATALQTAGAVGNVYWNTLDRRYRTVTAGSAQDSSLGWELDYLMSYRWDEHLKISLSSGLYFPGAFWKFNNSATENETKMVWGTNVGLSVAF